jgi:FkbH-like protein
MFAKRLTPFFNLSITKEDKSKAQAYQEQSKREQIKASFENIDDYLKALDIEISLKLNDEQSLARYSQLTQKTNQFNLRTVRYTEQDIRNLLLSETHDLFSISVRDKFGESGITGLCILKYDTHAASIDTFLLSCRIIGRKIEFKMMNSIIEYLIQQNVQFLHAEYKRTAKNELAQNFLENCGFVAIGISDSVKRYNMELNRWEKKDVPFIALESSLTAVTNDQQQ